MQASVDNLQQTIVYDGIAGALTPHHHPPSRSIHILPQCENYTNSNNIQ
jgi:hypothetical protein